MKRILQSIGAAILAVMPQAAPAFDGGLALDQFPSAGRAAPTRSPEWRGEPAVSGHRSFHEARHDGGRRRSGSFHEVRGDRQWAEVDRWRDAGRYRARGSFVEVSPFGGAVERGSFYGTSGTGGSFVVIGLPGGGGGGGGLGSSSYGQLRGGAKILDVEADRLDRRPYGRDGLAVAHVGTSKIIRISPDFRPGRASGADEADEGVATPFAELSPEEQAVTVYPDTDMAERPVDPPSPRMAETAPAAPAAIPGAAPSDKVLEPWSPEWLRDCVARHPSFDASLGTYTSAEGRRRFCTGEP